MFTPHNLLRSCALVLGFATAAMGDTVILKNGEKVEGRIIEETDAKVTVKVQVTPTISDDREIKRADIEKIDKVKEDEEAWPALKGLTLGAESFESSDYQAAIFRLTDFVTRFPQSAHAAEAKAKAAEFEAEKKRVDAGEIKDDGKWLTKEQVQEERVQITGRVLFARMKRLAAGGQLVDAMNVYDAMEKNFNGAFAMPDAIDLAKQIVPRIKVAADQQRKALTAQKDANKKRIETAQGAERTQLETLLKNQTAATEAAVTAAEKSGMRWLPLNPANDRSLSALSSRAGGEVSSLNSKPVDKMRQSIKSAEAARDALAANDVSGAEKLIIEALGAWSNNELAKRLQPKLAEARKTGAANKTAEAEAKAKAAAEAAAAAAAAAKPKPTPTPVTTSTVAVTDEPAKPEEDPFYKKPILYVGLGVLGLGAFLGRKALHKFSDPNKNLLDQ